MNFYLNYEKNNDTVTFAATELSDYLSAANHTFHFWHNPASVNEREPYLTIHLAIEETAASSLDDAYKIKISPENSSICGSNARSVLLGVYAYLRKIGFRFLLPGKTYIPEITSKNGLFADFSHHASLRHRGVCIEGANSLENVLDFIDWLPKLGFNSFFLQFKEPYIFLERWYHHKFNPYLKKSELTEDFLQSGYQQMGAAMEKRSLLYHAFGHGWTCESIGIPSLGWIPVEEEPSDANRKLLALVNGKKEYIDRIPINTNLCYSNPKAMETFCDSVVSYVEHHPFVDYLHIWLADEPNHICECEACKKSTPTDQYIRLLNKIDDRLTKKNLNCKLVFLLYQELLYPPVTENIHNPDRFTLMFAPISRTFKTSYPDQISEIELPVYQRNQMVLPVTIGENLTYLKKWQAIFSGDSMDYDYPLGRAHYGDFGYVNISRTLAGDIKNVKNLGMNGYMSCQELRAFLPNGLPNYVMGQLTLDNNQTFEALMEEYYKAAYGENYALILEYLTQVSALSDCDYFNRIGSRKDDAICAKYQELLTYLSDFSTQIKTGALHISHFSSSNDRMQSFFLNLLDYHADYSILLTKALIALSSGDSKTANTRFMEFCHFIRQNEMRMQPYLDVYRIIDVATNYTGFQLP